MSSGRTSVRRRAQLLARVVGTGSATNLTATEQALALDPLAQEAQAILCQALNNPMARFRAGQWEAIEALFKERGHLLVVQRTGWGKSLVYFVSTVMLRRRGSGPTLLISPLISLMRNQIDMAQRLGLSAETINSSNTREWEQIKNRILANEIDILLISPERLANQAFRERVLMQVADRVGLLVIDEAHCISDWGHDFRPDYQRIARILRALPQGIPVLATTATANSRVVNDIIAQLGTRLQVQRGPLARSSLHLQAISLPKQEERLAWLAEHVPQMPGSGIIYTLTIKDAQRVANWLQSQGTHAVAYWGALDDAQRRTAEQDLLNNRVKALVATSALGMGFDKPDLGFVIHYQKPQSMVHYYQQVGRAGRAIDDAYGILLSGEEDDEIIDSFATNNWPPEDCIQQILSQLVGRPEGLTRTEIRARVNFRQKDVDQSLKLLSAMTPAPVGHTDGNRWRRNAVRYAPNLAHRQGIMECRDQERREMGAYVFSRRCLMRMLEETLDDPEPHDCGHCSNCIGQPLLPARPSNQLVVAAQQFLQQQEFAIAPRKQWPRGAFRVYSWSGYITDELRAQEGRALCRWGDFGWGDQVRQGKQVSGRFEDDLVQGTVDLVRTRWRPEPFPQWVTCAPSRRHNQLVPDFARRVAAALEIPFVDCLSVVRQHEPQKTMQNSFRQAANLDGAFGIDSRCVRRGPVLLIDDMVDSGWTMTVLTALLRQNGSGPVFPFALASTRPQEG